MKYKVGDKVKIRNDLEMDKTYYSEDGEYWDDCTEEMVGLRGEYVTIKEKRGHSYFIEEFQYNWTDEMFEDISEYTYTVEPFSSFLSYGEYTIQVHNDAIYPKFDTIAVDDFEQVMELMKQAKLLQEEYAEAVKNNQ